MLPSYVFIYKHREKVPNFIISQLLKDFVLEFRICTSRFPHNLIHSFKKNINGIVGIGNGIDKSFRCSNELVIISLQLMDAFVLKINGKFQIYQY